MEEKGNGHFTLVRGNITGLINPIKIRQFNFAQEEKGDNSERMSVRHRKAAEENVLSVFFCATILFE